MFNNILAIRVHVHIDICLSWLIFSVTIKFLIRFPFHDRLPWLYIWCIVCIIFSHILIRFQWAAFTHLVDLKTIAFTVTHKTQKSLKNITPHYVYSTYNRVSAISTSYVYIHFNIKREIHNFCYNISLV